MFRDLTPEREEEIIETVAEFIVKHGLTDTFTMFYDNFFKIYPGFVGQMGAYYFFPYSGLLGQLGPELSTLLASNPRKNFKLIMERVRALEVETLLREKEIRLTEKDKPRQTLWSYLSNRLRSLFS